MKKITDEMLASSQVMFRNADVQDNGCLTPGEWTSIMIAIETDKAFAEMMIAKAAKAAAEAEEAAAAEAAAAEALATAEAAAAAAAAAAGAAAATEEPEAASEELALEEAPPSPVAAAAAAAAGMDKITMPLTPDQAVAKLAASDDFQEDVKVGQPLAHLASNAFCEQRCLYLPSVCAVCCGLCAAVPELHH